MGIYAGLDESVIRIGSKLSPDDYTRHFVQINWKIDVN